MASERARAPVAGGPRGRVFQGERVAVGAFVARPGDPWFSDSGPARGHLVVFPWLPVRITHAGAAPVVADPTRVMLYNQGQEYRREIVSPEGDRCIWISLASEDALDAVRAHDPRGRERPAHPFSRTHGPCSPESWLCHRLLFARASGACPADALEIEEIGMLLLDRVLAGAYGTTGHDPSPNAARAHAALADAVKAVAAARGFEPLSLGAVARAVGASPFHLARVFRRRTGHTIHGYLHALRLSRAALRLADGEHDLTALALDLGYASHSHFTYAFRRRFGVPPSQVRRLAAGPGLAALRRLASPRAGS